MKLFSFAGEVDEEGKVVFDDVVVENDGDKGDVAGKEGKETKGKSSMKGSQKQIDKPKNKEVTAQAKTSKKADKNKNETVSSKTTENVKSQAAAKDVATKVTKASANTKKQAKPTKQKQPLESESENLDDKDESDEGEEEVEEEGEGEGEDTDGLTGRAATFEELGLSKWLQAQCREMGCVRPTEIQTACIPRILKGEDCIGAAKTGSGKTAAFALPMLQVLSKDPYGVFALVLTPTRELAFQIAEQFQAFGQPLNLKVCVVVGGLDMMKQSVELSKRPHIVVATPGRLADHLNSTANISFKRIKFLVLDEADRMLSDTFSEDLTTILGAVPSKRQTLLFSATMTNSIDDLKRMSMSTPFVYEVRAREATVTKLDQRYVFVPSQVKDCYTWHMLQNMGKGQMIIFTSTCRSCQELVVMLRNLGQQCVGLHSKMSQNDRLASLNRFRDQIISILVATDVASRGLDIPTVQTVLNFDVPSNPDDYIHRVGRTARAGRGGVAITIITQYDVERVQRIEERIGKKLASYDVAEDEVLKGMNTVAKARRAAYLEMSEKDWGQRDRVNKEKKRMLEQMHAGGDSTGPKEKKRKVAKGKGEN